MSTSAARADYPLMSRYPHVGGSRDQALVGELDRALDELDRLRSDLEDAHKTIRALVGES